jgi:hypothetical protein
MRVLSLHLLRLTLLLLVDTWVNPAGAAEAAEETCKVTYDAPAACPGVSALQQASGAHFVIVPGGSECEDCVTHVRITVDPAAPDTYLLETGNEVTRDTNCAELVKIAGFTLRSSHVHMARQPHTPQQYLGVHAARLFIEDPHWAFGAQFGVRVFETWIVRPQAGWTPKHTIADAPTVLDYEGYQVGLDVCRDVTRWAAACALGELQRFSVVPRVASWTAPWASQVAFGLGGSLSLPLVAGLEAQLQPGLLFAPRPARTRESDWSTVLHERPRWQVQIRAGLSWGFGG